MTENITIENNEVVVTQEISRQSVQQYITAKQAEVDNALQTATRVIAELETVIEQIPDQK